MQQVFRLLDQLLLARVVVDEHLEVLLVVAQQCAEVLAPGLEQVAQQILELRAVGLPDPTREALDRSRDRGVDVLELGELIAQLFHAHLHGRDLLLADPHEAPRLADVGRL